MYVVVRRSRPTGFPVRKSTGKYTLTFGFSVKFKHAIYILLGAFLQILNYQTQKNFKKMLFSRVE